MCLLMSLKVLTMRSATWAIILWVSFGENL